MTVGSFGRHRYAAMALAVAAALLGAVLVPRVGGPAGQPISATATGPMELPDDWMNAQRAGADGVVPTGAMEAAAAQAQRLADRTAEDDPALAAAEWELEGPTNIGGRVTDLAVDPEHDDTLYVAAATGGVWRSTDAGDTMASIWPDDLPQAIGALAIASDATLFAGTGEANPGGGSSVFGGNGVYRSRDRGETWEHVGLRGSGAIGELAVHPGDDDVVFVAATGPLFTPGGERGLYRSTDGGDTWKLVLEGANDTTGAVDIAIDPRQPDRVYVTMWDRRREPDLRRYGGEGSGVWRSTDGGETWERLTDGLPTGPEVGRIGVAVAATPEVAGALPGLAPPGRLYALVVDHVGPFEGFYTSVDGGDTWVELPANPLLSSSQSTFGWWFGEVWVDPGNPLRVFAPGVPLVHSFDGGLTWASESTGIHADQHAMAWDPKVSGRVYLGNDGGVYRSDAGGLPGTWQKASYEPYTQFYSVDVSQTLPDERRVGGTQDNGCLRSYPDDWSRFGCGDGLQTLIHPDDPQIVYYCSQYGRCSRSTNGGDSGSTFSGRTTSQRRNWFTPLEFDPSDPQVMYYGGNILNRSTDGGVSWEPISPDLTDGPGRDTAYPFGTLTTVAAAPSDPDTIYVGTDDGLVWVTRDLGESWTEVDRGQLPGTWVTRVAVDPRDADVAYATFSGFRLGDDTPHVLRTADGGVTWSDISGDLPDAPVNDVVVIDGGAALLVATDVGVFLSRDLGERWLRVGRGLPLFLPVTDLRYHAPSDTVYAATFGRGIHRVVLPGRG